MQKEELGVDENRDPEPEPQLLGLKKEKCRPEGLEGQLHNLTNHIPAGVPAHPPSAPAAPGGPTPTAREAAERGAPLSPPTPSTSASCSCQSARQAARPPTALPHRTTPTPGPSPPPTAELLPRGQGVGPSTRWARPGRGRGAGLPRRRPALSPRSPEHAGPAPQDARNGAERWPCSARAGHSRGQQPARNPPKISYASKLKENLEHQPARVPASALRTAGPLPNGSPALPAEPQLGAIFQNQWGLSFINEPGAGQQTAPAAGHSWDCWQHMSPEDWEEARDYHTEAWDHIWELHRQAPSRVTVYADPLDGKG
nr:splicing factor, proline- and glutamine-rich-like isoform X2 [Chelonoidis abingdonii]